MYKKKIKSCEFSGFSNDISRYFIRAIFHSRNFINQVDFLVGKGLLCLYDKQNNT